MYRRILVGTDGARAAARAVASAAEVAGATGPSHTILTAGCPCPLLIVHTN